MILLALIWAIGANWLAFRKGFFKLPTESPKAAPFISTKQLLFFFGIYLILALLLAPISAKLLMVLIHKAYPDVTSLPITILTALQFCVMIVIFLFLIGYSKSLSANFLQDIWNPKKRMEGRPIEFSFGIGVASWFLAFPLASVIAEFIDHIVQSVFGLSHYEQTAVQFVKAAAEVPTALTFAFASVLIMAPLIEEFLFRGIMQTYFKRRLGTLPAILLTSLSFGIFHFSPGQGMGNISLIIALFVLGCFLGLLYEKHKSLWAPIGLHMTFNAISALRIVFFPEAS